MQLRCLRLCVALLLPVAGCASHAPPAPPAQAAPDRFDGAVSAAAAQGFAGNVLVQRNGAELALKSVGMANEELAVPHTRSTRFKIHSTTKPFTAAAVLLLVRDGKLALDAPIASILSGLPASWGAITVRHLLQHTSGIPPEIENVWLETWAKVDAGEELAVLAAAAPKFADKVVSRPGQTWAYSNMGYELLACIVARAGGAPFASFVHDRVLVPAGMHDTVFDSQAPIKHDMYSGNAVVPHLASGYNGTRGNLETTTSMMYVERGAGGLITTADDLARFASMVWRGPLLDERLRALIFEQAYVFNAGTDHESRYGLGWVERARDGRRVIRHDGGNNGFVADLEIWPTENLVIVVLSNHGFFEGIGALVEQLSRAAFASPVPRT